MVLIVSDVLRRMMQAADGCRAAPFNLLWPWFQTNEFAHGVDRFLISDSLESTRFQVMLAGRGGGEVL